MAVMIVLGSNKAENEDRRTVAVEFLFIDVSAQR